MLRCSLIKQNPNLGAFWVVTYVIVRQNHSISDVLLKLAERTERTHSTLRGHVAVVVPMFRALIVVHVGWSPWQLGFKERDTLLSILPFVWFFWYLKM